MQLVYMTNLRVRASFIIADGKVMMQLRNQRVRIPSHYVKKSKVMMNVLSAALHSRVTHGFLFRRGSTGKQQITLAAPTEWFEAWVACFVTRKKKLGCEDSAFLMNCLMVRMVSAPEAQYPAWRLVVYCLLMQPIVHPFFWVQ
jgi:hypothetical protein